MNKLIYGKDSVKRIVASEVKDDYVINYIADGNKTIKERRDFYNFVLTEEWDQRYTSGRLEGSNELQYFSKFHTKNEVYQYCRKLDQDAKNYWRCYNQVESAMLREGFTYYKDMNIKDVSVMSFDIETTGVTINENSYVLLISNTFRDRKGVITKRLFDFSEYDSPKDFITAWCMWFRECDPDTVVGHNLFGFDLPYLANFAKLHKVKLNLGRDASAIKFDRNPRRFRKDGSQAYDYINARIFGREIIDTFFLSMKYDILRNYPNYKLKDIIAYEGLEKEGRQHWDFSKNKEPWNDPREWLKFCQYAEDDADDALALFDLMAPQFFYYTQSIPKQFQEIINTATGSQVNSFMMRSYLQDSKAVPLASTKVPFEGGISMGNPGLYHNVYKIDVASLYPSIMLSYCISSEDKDPDGRFLEAVKFFTDQRLENKRLAAETGERKYKDLSNGQKIMINSFYGFMGAPGLNFNYPDGAAEVTRRGRAILTQAIDWCSAVGHDLVNADTDSISYQVTDNSYISEHLDEINRISTKGIVWEIDELEENGGVYDAVLVVKAKNYALKTGDKVKIKGSALKATMKETALKEFLKEAIDSLLTKKIENVHNQYLSNAKEITDLSDITPWCSKKTITKAVLDPQRTNEQRVLDALSGEHYQEGDKVRMFFETPTKLCLDKNFQGVYDKDKLYEKLFKTVKVLSPVLDMEKFPNYKLKKNKALLEEI